MKDLYWLLILSAFALCSGCGDGDDDSGSAGTGGASAGSSGSGGSSTGGASSGGASSGGASSGGASSGGSSSGGTSSGGSSGGGGSPCARGCATAASLNCPNENGTTCVSECETSITTVASMYPNCTSQFAAALNCVASTPASSWECNADGQAVVSGTVCDAEGEAFANCVLGG